MKKLLKKTTLLLLVFALTLMLIPMSSEAKTKKAKAQKTSKAEIQKEEILNATIKKISQLNKRISSYYWEVYDLELIKSTKKEARIRIYLESPDNYFDQPIEIRTKRVASGLFTYKYFYDGRQIKRQDIIYTCAINAYDPFAVE